MNGSFKCAMQTKPSLKHVATLKEAVVNVSLSVPNILAVVPLKKID